MFVSTCSLNGKHLLWLLLPLYERSNVYN